MAKILSRILLLSILLPILGLLILILVLKNHLFTIDIDIEYCLGIFQNIDIGIDIVLPHSGILVLNYYKHSISIVLILILERNIRSNIDIDISIE